MTETQDIIRAPLTPKSDKKPHIVKVKVFWKHTHHWTDADIAKYRADAPKIAESIQNAGVRHTCDKFALTVLIHFAFINSLPIKIKTGSGIFRNVMFYKPELDQFASSLGGFSDMALPHFTAHDVKNNAKPIPGGRCGLKPGDLLLEDNAHSGHVQVVMRIDAKSILIKQGNFPSNFDAVIDRIFGKIKSIFTGKNDSSIPGSPDYLGVPIQDGSYRQSTDGTWHYRNVTFKRNDDSWVKKMDHFMQWDFNGFNT